ncbi:phoenix [Chaetodon trifascialis]|uniref:phoenix n=1 Tax=Chaetodon trifascialis TaxID=109706 RepID=UPI00399108C7
MTGAHDSLTWTQPDVMAETPIRKPRHVVLEMSSPDYVEKISRFLESSAGQSKQDTVSNEAAGAESDSGDSLFITQKPVPEAERSRRRRQHHPRSEPTSPRDFQDSESDASSSASHGESKTAQERRRTKYRPPQYSFPFLTGRKWKPQSSLLPVKQNTSLHNSTMGGFFKCVRDDVDSSLPTLDMEGGDISPLSEEEEGSEDEDIKVVERKCLVAPSKKAKRQQTWCSQLKQDRRNAGDAREETSRGRQCELLDKTPAKASTSRTTPLCLDTGSADNGESSCGGVVEREGNNEPVTSDGNFLAKMETPETKRYLTRGKKKVLFEQKAREEELCIDSDATVCEPEKLQSPSKYTESGREASTAAGEPRLAQSQSQSLLHSLPLLFSDSNNDSSCNEARVKKRKKKKKNRDRESVEEESDQRQEEPEDQHAVKSVNVEVERTPSLSEGNRAEPVASQTSDELEFNGRTCLENSSHVETIARQKERDKRKRSAADSIRQEVDGNLESDVKMEDAVFSVSCNGVRKKKKRMRSDEDVEKLQSSTAAEPLNDDAETQVKKKRRKKEETTVEAAQGEEEEAVDRAEDLPPVSTGWLKESGNALENTAASEETQSSYVKRKKHKKKRQFSNHAAQDGGEGGDVSFSNDAATLEESTAVSQKKKKKALTEEAGDSHTAEENEKFEDECNTQKTIEGLEDPNADLVTKKKKKKKKTRSSRNVSEDGVMQSDDSVSVRKKEKKRTSSSFLVADAEESDAQTHSERKSASPSVQAEKPAVSAGDAETESAEITGKLEESNVGERKKKRKRKVSVQQDSVEKEHERDFEEANKTCQSALPGTTDTSELVTSVERVESAADEDVVSKKKKKKKKKKTKDEPCRVVQESPQAAAEDTESKKSSLTTCTLVSHKKKGKHRRSADVSHDSTSDLDTKKTLNMVEPASPSPETPGDQALNDIREEKKKKKKKKREFPDNILLEGKSSSKSAELEPRENKKKQRKKQSAVLSVLSSGPVFSGTSLSTSELSSSNKHITIKRMLYNPSKDFLTDC